MELINRQILNDTIESVLSKYEYTPSNRTVARNLMRIFNGNDLQSLFNEKVALNDKGYTILYNTLMVYVKKYRNNIL